MEINFLNILFLASIIQGFLLGFVILFSKFFRSNTNQYFGYTIIITAISSLNNWFWNLSTYPFIIDLLDLPLWQFLFPVTLAVFFFKATKYPINIRLSYLLFPFLFFTSINILISLETHYQRYALAIPAKQEVFTFFYQAVSICSILYAIGLSILSFKAVFLHHSELASFKSDALKWVKALWIGITALIALWIGHELIKLMVGQVNATYILASTSIFTYWIIYKGLYQFKLGNDQYHIQQIIHQRATTRTTQKTPKPIQGQDHFERFQQLCLDEKWHYDPDLSRDAVAEKLGISSGYLSQIVNKATGKSFPEVINQYRVNAAKAMILDPEFRNYSLLAIGLEAGFKSKSTFYTSFKKETGFTPGEFKKKS
ncbi:MAG: helix-turn-helix transcriptional regulator [Flammeovirgaceae bacterium]